MNYILGILLSALAFTLGSKVMNGSIYVKDFWSAVAIALVMSLLSATVGAVLNFFSAPINWITLGAFSFVVDAALILIASKILNGFRVSNFWTAFGLAIVVSAINWITHGFFQI